MSHLIFSKQESHMGKDVSLQPAFPQNGEIGIPEPLLFSRNGQEHRFAVSPGGLAAGKPQAFTNLFCFFVFCLF